MIDKYFFRDESGSQDVPAQASLVVASPTLRCSYSNLRRVPEVHHQVPAPWQLDRERNILLKVPSHFEDFRECRDESFFNRSLIFLLLYFLIYFTVSDPGSMLTI